MTVLWAGTFVIITPAVSLVTHVIKLVMRHVIKHVMNNAHILVIVKHVMNNVGIVIVAHGLLIPALPVVQQAQYIVVIVGQWNLGNAKHAQVQVIYSQGQELVLEVKR